MRRLVKHAAVFGGFVALALLFSHPMARFFSTRFMGTYGESSGCVWYLWNFRHALTTPGENPFWSDMQYWPFGANLLLTQAEPFNSAVAYFLIPLLGLIRTYNLIHLISTALGGYALYLMLRDWGHSEAAALAGGAAFAFCPINGLHLHEGEGPDYICYYVMPLFVWAFSRAVRGSRLVDCLLASLCLTLAWCLNYYYFLSCALVVPALYLAYERPVEVGLRKRAGPWRTAARLAFGGAAVALLWVLSALWRGQVEFHGAGSLRALLTYLAPYGAFWALIASGSALLLRPTVSFNREAFFPRRLFPYGATLGLWFALNLPMIVSMARFMASGGSSSIPHYWRGGGNPADVLWLILPNAFSPIFRGLTASVCGFFREATPDSITSMGLACLAGAVWLWRTRPKDRWILSWFALAAFFLVLALGPDLKLFGMHTYLPLPFFFLHLLPVFNSMPNGMYFGNILMVFMALLFAASLDEARRRFPGRFWARVFAPAVALLALEAVSSPRPMFDLSGVSPLLTRFADRPEGAFLPIPVGANFHLSADPPIVGDTWMADPIMHMIDRKPVVGGALGRTAKRVCAAMMMDPFFQGLLAAQGGRRAKVLEDPAQVRRYFRNMTLHYVLVDTQRSSPAMLAAVGRWPLRLIDREGPLKLYEILVN